MASILGIGECMVELSSADKGLWRQAFSGDVFNALWYARAYSSEDTEIKFHTALGTDPLSDEMIEFGQSTGISWSQTPRFADRRPGLYSIHLNGAERSFSYWRDTSAARMMMREADQLWTKVKTAQIIYLSGITLAILSPEDCETLLAGLTQHKSASAQIVFDPNIRPHLWSDHDHMRAIITKAASVSDIVMPSFDDETTTFGDNNPTETAKRYAALGSNHVVVKDGPNDTVHLLDGEITHFAVAPIDGVIDTTAAGDSFNGSYVAALIKGVPASKAISMAQACAGRVVQRKGALVSYADLRQDEACAA